MSKLKAVVIGSGIAGIASSIRMALRGIQVEVFEKNENPGGKLNEKWIGKYRFDLGPSLFTLPQNVDDLFTLAGENPKDHFEYTKLDRVCNYFFEDGKTFTSRSNVDEMADAMAEAFDVDRKDVVRFFEYSKNVYDLTTPVFLKSELTIKSLWKKKDTYKAIGRLYQLPISGTLNSALEKRFKDKKVVQLFNRYATYNGSNPYSTPAMMQLIPHLEHGIGAYLPKKGMYDITRSLYELALRLGVKFHFNQNVLKIVHANGVATGIALESGIVHSDIVVSNSDVYPTYRNLLSDLPAPEKILAGEKSSSALIFYWGIKKEFKNLELHNILFAKDYKAEFDAIFGSRTLCADPTVYINITSKQVKTDAPDGSENWFVMINVPHLKGHDWDVLRSEARKNVIQKINDTLNVDIESLIEEEEYLDPVIIQTRTGSHLGALYGNASNDTFSAFGRHANHSSSLKGLYFCGGSVHPGGGVPLCLFSAAIAVDRIKSDFKL
jgi:phytoene desaturase